MAGQFDREICSKERASAIVSGLLPSPIADLLIEATMRGKVKWFSRERGYRFITMSKHGITSSPRRMFEGRICRHQEMRFQFQLQDTNRGLRASAIQLKIRSEDSRRGDDRVKCGVLWNEDGASDP